MVLISRVFSDATPRNDQGDDVDQDTGRTPDPDRGVGGARLALIAGGAAMALIAGGLSIANAVGGSGDSGATTPTSDALQYQDVPVQDGTTTAPDTAPTEPGSPGDGSCDGRGHGHAGPGHHGDEPGPGYGGSGGSGYSDQQTTPSSPSVPQTGDIEPTQPSTDGGSPQI